MYVGLAGTLMIRVNLSLPENAFGLQLALGKAEGKRNIQGQTTGWMQSCPKGCMQPPESSFSTLWWVLFGF